MKIEAVGWFELLAITNLYVVISQKMVLFIDTIVRTSHFFSLVYSN